MDQKTSAPEAVPVAVVSATEVTAVAQPAIPTATGQMIRNCSDCGVQFAPDPKFG